jgi:hypothetical protein
MAAPRKGAFPECAHQPGRSSSDTTEKHHPHPPDFPDFT